MKTITKLVEKIGADNLIHFLCGFIIVAIGYPFGRNAVPYFFGVAIVAAVVKEYIDSKTDGKFDGIEMLATWIGAAFAMLYNLCILEIM